MELQFAPMEGITYYTYRNLQHAFFPGADVYYSPFIAPDSTGKYKAGSLKEVLPENNSTPALIPQILANNPEAFLSIANEMNALGYQEVNLNVGCPSGCVFNKHKGSGMLTDLTSFKAFLDRVFEASPVSISVKTRMGVNSTAEFADILALYNQYPIKELIVHARDRKGMYKSEPDFEGFLNSTGKTELPLSYNGNIYTLADYNRLEQAAPDLHGVMIGRGAICNPAIFRELKGGSALTKQELQAFHDAYLAATLETGLCEHFTVNRMKELWYYMEYNFIAPEKQLKAIYKCKTLADYRSATHTLLQNCCFSPDSGFGHRN